MASRVNGWTWIGGSRQVFVKVPYKSAPYFAEVSPDGSWEILTHPEGLRAEGGHVPPRESTLRPGTKTVAGAKSVASAALTAWMRVHADRAYQRDSDTVKLFEALKARVEVDATADDYPPPSIRRAM